MPLDEKTLQAVAFAGEMLIRAGAALGALTKAQQAALADSTQGALPNAIVEALDAAKAVSPSVAQSLQTHPPIGLAASPGR
jgi:hypothetical protein